ncbi:MAG: cyclin-like protein [Benjaminiella poitrasii]|nr:MAG: cyclin-like protein [Benjaminiella poitrasii]
MGTRKKRNSNNNNSSKQAAVRFLTNITLGNENEQEWTALNRGGYSLDFIPFDEKRRRRKTSFGTIASSSEVIEHLKRDDDSQRPIASEKIKKKLLQTEDWKNEEYVVNSTITTNNKLGIMSSVFRIIRHPRQRSSSQQELQQHYTRHPHQRSLSAAFLQQTTYHHTSYLHRHVSTMHLKHRRAISYGHFLSVEDNDKVTTITTAITKNDDDITSSKNHDLTLLTSSSSSSSSDDSENEDGETPINDNVQLPLQQLSTPLKEYNPYYFDSYSNPLFRQHFKSYSSTLQENESKQLFNKTKEIMNETFRSTHPDLLITLSKIQSIKRHLLMIGKSMDLEISTISHAYVYFEKLIQKKVVTKQNRKLVAACCLFLATKVNEPKGLDFNQLLETIQSEFDTNPKEIRTFEFDVFADLEFNLYVPLHEFMPHFHRIIQSLDYSTVEDYLGYEDFYKLKKDI